MVGMVTTTNLRWEVGKEGGRKEWKYKKLNPLHPTASGRCSRQYCIPLEQEQWIVPSERTSSPRLRQQASDYQQVASGMLCRGYLRLFRSSLYLVQVQINVPATLGCNQMIGLKYKCKCKQYSHKKHRFYKNFLTFEYNFSKL